MQVDASQLRRLHEHDDDVGDMPRGTNKALRHGGLTVVVEP